MSPSETQRLQRGTWIATSTLAMIAIIYVVCLFIPKMRSVSATLANLETKQAFVLNAHQSRSAAEHAQQELVTAQRYNQEQSANLLRPEDLPTLYGQISNFTKAHQLATPRFEPRAPVAYETLQKISIGLGVSGSFASIHALLRDLENLPQQVWIDQLTMRGPREGGKNVECDMTLVVFIDNPEKSD